ncbi:MAG TPA: cytochrome P450 [Stellaceae bacterium]|nr:cytochrome P450 [Stellaceae bacterium]
MGIAEEFRPLGAGFAEIYAFLKRARDEAPVFYWQEHDVWVVSRYDDVQKVLIDPVFSNEGNLGVMNNSYCPEAKAILAGGIDFMETPQVNALEGEDHARVRKVMLNILTPKRFRSMEGSVRTMVTKLIDGFVQDGRCDFVTQFCYPLPVQVIFDVIGFKVEEENLEQLQTWSDDMFRLWLTPMSPEDQVRCARHAVQFQRYMKEKMAERRRAPRDDLLSEFVRQLDSGEAKASEDEIVIMFPMNLIGAGHETTKSALSNAMYQLLSQPSRWQDVVAHPETLSGVVDECLRIDSSVMAWYRTVAEDVELSGVRLEKGAKIVALIGAANHDERHFKDAESFCPVGRTERSGHLSFSIGRHFCLGAPLARMEMKIALEELAKRLPNLRMAPGQSIEYDPAVATRVIKHLQLEWDAPRALH